MLEPNQALEHQVEQLIKNLNNFFELQKANAKELEELNQKLGKIALSFFHLESLIKAEVIGLSAVIAMLIPLLIKIISLC